VVGLGKTVKQQTHLKSGLLLTPRK
jgi:hypothetical protein